MTSKETQGQLWEVFIQTKPGMAFKHAGSVHAYDKDMAAENARDTYFRRGEGTALWVVPSQEIVAIDQTENPEFFEAIDEKIYRHPTFYEIPAGVTHM